MPFTSFSCLMTLTTTSSARHLRLCQRGRYVSGEADPRSFPRCHLASIAHRLSAVSQAPRVKLALDYTKILRKSTNIWKFNTTLLNSLWVKEELETVLNWTVMKTRQIRNVQMLPKRYPEGNTQLWNTYVREEESLKPTTCVSSWGREKKQRESEVHSTE